MKWFFVLASFLFLVPQGVSAHIRYFLDNEQVSRLGGSDWKYILEPFSNLQYISVLLLALIIIVVLYLIIVLSPDSLSYVRMMTSRLATYGPMISWILRTCVGVALISFGTKSLFLSPLTSLQGVGSFFQILPIVQIVTGFFLIFGFLITISCFVLVALYFIALVSNWYILTSFEIFAIALSLIILDARVPGIDHILNIPDEYHPSLIKFVPTILRFSVGISFIILGIYEKIMNPHFSDFVFQTSQIHGIIPINMWVLTVGMFEVLIGVLLILGFKTRLLSLFSAIALCTFVFCLKADVSYFMTTFGSLIALIITGSGAFSLDNLFGKIIKTPEIAKE